MSHPVLLTMSGCLWACAGFATLSLAMPRHLRDVTGTAQVSVACRVSLRGLGSSALGLSGLACILARNAPIGVVQWCGVLSLAAVLVVLLLSYRPRWVAFIAPAGLAAAMGSHLLGLLDG